MTLVTLPAALVVRYRAVDREVISAPAHVVDTPAHLHSLTRDIRERGILVPLDLAFNEGFATLDAVISAHGHLRSIALSLWKIASDVRLMGMGPRAGIGELALPETQPGSSIMPGKVNPVIVESLTMDFLARVL